jgi:hypothetical protein
VGAGSGGAAGAGALRDTGEDDRHAYSYMQLVARPGEPSLPRQDYVSGRAK